MKLAFKFKIVWIHPRSRLIRWWISNEYCAHVMLDNGSFTYVHVPTPKYYKESEFLSLIAEALKKKLKSHVGLLSSRPKGFFESSHGYVEKIMARISSYSYSGLESGELEVEV